MSTENNWREQSIESLEKRNYGDPLTAQTSLIKKTFEYTKVAVGNLSIEQLRLLIGQEIGLTYLVPLALEELDKNILAEGDLYEGDLLKNVIAITPSYWEAHPELYNSLKNMIENDNQKIIEAGINLSNSPNL